ncbi:MAG: alpha-N-arabinofuranosidase [Ruminococcus sp.]|nr:alpha-N-arabinofuranosidase [Ruminococcus sp.]
MKKINMLINAADRKSRINPEIYGHFSEHLGRCIYEGLYVGEDSPIPNTDGVRDDVAEAFKAIKMPVLRWPGGCFADEYHWRDGIGEKSSRKKMINTNWGHVTEDNSFGTHEFMNLCERLGCEPYVAGNMGSGTVRELAEWVEYMTFDGMSPMAELRRKNGREKAWKLKYLGIGNESWGCGGNMRPEYYADEYRKYQTFCKNFSGNELYKVACGPNADDYNWTEVMMKNLDSSKVNAISLHYYTIPTGDWSAKGAATEFSDSEYYDTISGTLYMETLIDGHSRIMDRYDSEKKIGLIVDEWGCWYDVEKGTNPGFLYQQNTMRDAVVAACNLNIFNSRSDRVVMANLAQAVNVLQALILTEGEKMVKTPTYHVFDLYKGHQGGEYVYSHIENETAGDKIPMINASASVKDGVLTLTAANCSIDDEAELSVDIQGMNVSEAVCRILTNDVRAYNDFDEPEKVTISSHNVSLANGILTVTLPRCSVVSVTLK